jgi:hypothetical protein
MYLFSSILIRLLLYLFNDTDSSECRSQWQRGLRHELSPPAQTLGSWVRIPLEAWMSVCIYSVFVLSYAQVAALRWADPPLKESYRLCKRPRNWKSGLGPTKGCKAMFGYNHQNGHIHFNNIQWSKLFLPEWTFAASPHATDEAVGLYVSM